MDTTRNASPPISPNASPDAPGTTSGVTSGAASSTTASPTSGAASGTTASPTSGAASSTTAGPASGAVSGPSPVGYHFVLPQLKTAPFGKEGEIAQYIPYHCNNSDVTAESVRAEVARLPHMARLAEALDPNRRLYLLSGKNKETLLLAAEYIGNFHYPRGFYVDEDDESEDAGCPSDAMDSIDTTGEEDTCDLFRENMPYIESLALERFYNTDPFSMGFGGFHYCSESAPRKNPWWTRHPDAPIVVELSAYFTSPKLVNAVNAMAERQRIILLALVDADKELDDMTPDLADDDGMRNLFDNQTQRANSLSFELECECIPIDEPETDSAYKRAILRQLAHDKGASFAGDDPDALKTLSLIESARGNVDNATIAKAVSNALFRRKREGALTVADFQYLSEMFDSLLAVNKRDENERPLIGQNRVRAQIERVIQMLAFQKQRMRLGLPVDKLAYTFAFLGAPGTGKTTWATRLADRLHKLNLLDDTSMICINAAELKAKYVGHSTAKVRILFQQYGVIVLDEAYSLTEDGHTDNYTREVLAQLCVELEKHAGDRVVVFAGYNGEANDNRMLRFLKSNPGLNSRIAFKISFDDFEPEELAEVFHSMLAWNDYTLPADQKPAVDADICAYFRSRMKEKGFGNCREARNLADRAKIMMAARLGSQPVLTKRQAREMLPEDVRKAIAELWTEYRKLYKKEGSL